MTMISVLINGTPHAVAAGTTLEELLASMPPQANNQPFASAVNGTYIARQARCACVLGERDDVTTFEPITGG